MATILAIGVPDPASALPAVGLLSHTITACAAEAVEVLDHHADVWLLDARDDLMAAHTLVRTLRAAGATTPVLAWVTESGLAAVSRVWADDFILGTESVAQLDARLRLFLTGPAPDQAGPAPTPPAEPAGGVHIDEIAYTAVLEGRALDLTFTEFELLKFFVAHPGRVFSRDQLLVEVWGSDYFGGTRTVDVHVRRLRAKLGESAGLISTVRNVGYRYA